MQKNIYHKIGEILLTVYLSFLLFIMPLYAPEGYIHLAMHKWNFFKVITYGAVWGRIPIPGILILLVIVMVLENLFSDYETIKFNKADIFLCIFTAVITVSCFLSVYFYIAHSLDEAMMGQDGWYMGFLAQIAFILLYFVIRRYWKDNAYFWKILLIVSTVIFLIAYLNRFSLYLPGFQSRIEESEQWRYVSTLGNINWYACYLVLHYPLSAYFYLNADKPRDKAIYGLCFMIASATAVTQGSDSVFGVLVVFFLYLFFHETSDKKKWRGYLRLLFLFFSACAVTGILQRLFFQQAVIVEGFSGTGTMSFLPWAGMICCLVFLYIKKVSEDLQAIKKYAGKIIMIACMLLGVYMLLNSLDLLPEAFRTYGLLRFNDSWGNNRGSLWMIGGLSLYYMSMGWPYVIALGAGPDQFGRLIHTYASEEILKRRHNSYAACAHNEFMNTFCNYGFLGLIAWCLFWYFLLKKSNTEVQSGRMLKCMIILYLVNSFVSIQNIEAAPLLFAFAGMLRTYEQK